MVCAKKNAYANPGAPTYAWVIYANVPYLLWVAFATALQLTITYLNR